MCGWQCAWYCAQQFAAASLPPSPCRESLPGCRALNSPPRGTWQPAYSFAAANKRNGTHSNTHYGCNTPCGCAVAGDPRAGERRLGAARVERLRTMVCLWCSMLQRVAACCSVVQCVVVGAARVERLRTMVFYWCSVFQCVAVCCSVLQRSAVCCGGGSVSGAAENNSIVVVQCVAECCSVLQRIAVCCGGRSAGGAAEKEGIRYVKRDTKYAKRDLKHVRLGLFVAVFFSAETILQWEGRGCSSTDRSCVMQCVAVC